MECISGRHKDEIGFLNELIFQGRSGDMDQVVIDIDNDKTVVDHPGNWQDISHVIIEPATSENFMK
jgi:hypothetical protein